MLTNEQKEQFERDGYLIVRGLISREEAVQLRDHFMDLHAQGPKQGFDPKSADEADSDVLRMYPRFMHPHRVDDLSMKWMLDARFEGVLRDLFGEQPVAAQSMFYYKPAGARGQALHQDNFYLEVAPGSCMAAWVALDEISPDNGGLFIVPGSHKTDVQCPHVADLTQSFTTEEVDVPEGMTPVPANMELGDVLFFNGSVIHGSYPNNTKDRFRRSFICHYLGEGSKQISEHYFPLHRFDGTPIQKDEVFAVSSGGGVCGSEAWQDLMNARVEKVVLA
ncbi:MAG TPA: phytanoyl-CoA dioxygenase family protein [Abditibacteriaceae bacterium]|jgi:ectoine hydroxylase-related dioxygenase (phytanoyl-CoA dioxygenase family)